MRIVLAADEWRAAHIGHVGRAWCLGHGLMARGHQVDVILPSGESGSSEDQWIHHLPARWPTAGASRLAVERLGHATNALTSVQRELLSQTGPVTDSTKVNIDDVDALLAIGIRSPHVRGLVGRALGRVPTVIHLDPDDAPLFSVPVIRQDLRAHALVTHWPSWACRTAADLGRAVDIIALGIDSDDGMTDRVAGSRSLGAEDAATMAAVSNHPYVVWARGNVGTSDNLWEPTPPITGAVVVAAHDDTQSPLGHGFVSFIGPRAGRLDGILGQARALIASPGDMGDLGLVAWFEGCPVIAAENSSLAADVRRSGGGWVVDDGPSLSEALAESMRDEARSRAVACGRDFVLKQRTWNRVLPHYERLLTSVVDG